MYHDDVKALTEKWVEATQSTMQEYLSQFLFQPIDAVVKYKIKLFLSSLGCALPFPEKRFYGLSFNNGSINVDILDRTYCANYGSEYDTYIAVATHYDSKYVRQFADAYPEYAEYVKDYNTQRYNIRLFVQMGEVR